MRLRPARRSDLDALASLEAAAFDDPWPRDHLAGEMDHAGSHLVVAETATETDGKSDGESVADPGLAVGYAAFRTAAGEAELLRLAVTPAWRRRGVAALLLAAGDAALAESGAEICYLEVRPDNRAALAFYEAAGFHRLGRRPRYYADGSDALLLARAVRPPVKPTPATPPDD